MGNFMPYRIGLLSITFLFMSACGGGGGGSSSPVQSASSLKDTTLRNNPISQTRVLTQFKSAKVEINADQYTFVDDHLYLKLALASGELLFVGEINRYGKTIIPINVTNDIEMVKSELFTTSAADEIVFGEIAL